MEKDKHKGIKILHMPFLPTLRQFFTKCNIRAVGFIVLGIVCFLAKSELGQWGVVGNGINYNYFAQDYQNAVMHNISNIANNTYETVRQLNETIKYFFGILGGLFLLLGITNFKFKS